MVAIRRMVDPSRPEVLAMAPLLLSLMLLPTIHRHGRQIRPPTRLHVAARKGKTATTKEMVSEWLIIRRQERKVSNPGLLVAPTTYRQRKPPLLPQNRQTEPSTRTQENRGLRHHPADRARCVFRLGARQGTGHTVRLLHDGRTRGIMPAACVAVPYGEGVD